MAPPKVQQRTPILKSPPALVYPGVTAQQSLARLSQPERTTAANLYSPATDTSRAGSNTNSWENSGPFTTEQTAKGYGDVPPMSMNDPQQGLAGSTAWQGKDGSLMNRVKGLAKGWLGNQEGMVGNNYMYTGVDGSQGTLDMSGIDAQYMNDPAVIDAINNPTKGSLAGGTSSFGMGDMAEGVKALSGLASAYTGYKNYGLAKEKFAFEKAAANRNIANQASEYNTGLQNAGEVGMSLAGNTMDANARLARQAQLNGQMISGAPLG